jgi:hypothetical protein
MNQRVLSALSVAPLREIPSRRFGFPSRRSLGLICVAELIFAWSQAFSRGSSRLILPSGKLGSCWQLVFSRSSCSFSSSRTP